MEHDQFYDKLPFTLTEQQTTPQYVIFGTGLQQCLIAAYKSRTEMKTGLIIDTQKTYGSSLKTVTLKQFHLLSTQALKEKMYDFVTSADDLEHNQKYYDQCIQNKKFRGYSIDIEPNFFFASSITCQCLKQADMDKYMDFHLVKNILHIHDNSFRPVPLSKGKIFQSKELSLLQKKNLLMSIHKLIKIYHKYMKLQQDINSTKQFDKGFGDISEQLYHQFQQGLNDYFLPFIEGIVKKNKKIMNYLTYIICNYQYNYQKDIPQHAKNIYTLKGFIEKFGKFIKSCGIYGESPYLYVDNGIGDIPQAFSRIASIYGSTYILHPKITIDSINCIDGQFTISSNLSPEIPIKTKQIYFGPTFLDLRKVQQEYYEQKILRVLVICQKNGKQEQCPAICFIPQMQDFINPVYLFIFDGSTQSCPNNLIMYQFQSILQNNHGECHEKGVKCLKKLESVYGESFKESIRYNSVYIRTRRYPKVTKNTQKDIGLNDTMGIDLDQHFNNFMNVIGTKEHYFKKQNKNEEEDEPFGGYETNYLLEKLEKINLNEQPKQANQNQQHNQPIPECKEQEEQAQIHNVKQQNQLQIEPLNPIQQNLM